MQGVHLRKYAVQATIDFELYEIDGVDLRVDAVSASGDINLVRNGAAEEELDADAFVDEGRSYSLVLSGTEMQAARIIVYIVDQTSPKAWLDKVLIVETYGNALAQHAFDLDTAATTMRGTDNAATEAKQDVIDGIVDTIALNVAGLDGAAMVGTNNAATEAKQDVIDALIDELKAAVITNAAGVDIAADIIALKAETVTILADTNELQSDNIPGTLSTIEGKIDTIDGIVDNILTDTGTTLDDRLVLLQKFFLNKLVVDVDNSQMILYDDDNSTPLYTFALLDKDDASIGVDVGVPVNRAKGAPP